jgi:hypothetical protein
VGLGLRLGAGWKAALILQSDLDYPSAGFPHLPHLTRGGTFKVRALQGCLPSDRRADGAFVGTGNALRIGVEGVQEEWGRLSRLAVLGGNPKRHNTGRAACDRLALAILVEQLVNKGDGEIGILRGTGSHRIDPPWSRKKTLKRFLSNTKRQHDARINVLLH